MKANRDRPAGRAVPSADDPMFPTVVVAIGMHIGGTDCVPRRIAIEPIPGAASPEIVRTPRPIRTWERLEIVQTITPVRVSCFVIITVNPTIGALQSRS